MHPDEPEEWDGDGEIAHPLPKDLMFDHWTTLSSGDLASFSETITKQVITALGPAGRKPRADLVKGIGDIVPTIIANLLLLHRGRPDGSRLVVQMERRKNTRYDRKGFRKLPEVVNAMAALGHLIKHRAVFKQKRTTIEATGDLKHALQAPGIPLSVIDRTAGEEVIHLTARPSVRRIAGRKQPKTLVDYDDTEETIALKQEMEEINRFLASRSIKLEGASQPAFRLTRRFTLRSPDDPHEFEAHGRLYGGFWMTLKASERHRIRVDGEPVADLDFASMFPRLAYLAVGQLPPEGDLYALPGLEGHRDGAKAGLSALLSYPSKMKSLPPRLKQMLPEGWTASRLRRALAAHHPHLVPFFEKDFGLDLMFTESRILLTAMRQLMEQDIPALPMHDGMMVPRSKVDSAVQAMRHASEKVTGFPIPVSLKV
ncbi:hypothetical protein [Stappia sp.]|uniref:hypothetical protein n=1 Tax=Stappia sp. TaxID=1870903 RepID=UPI003C7998BE